MTLIIFSCILLLLGIDLIAFIALHLSSKKAKITDAENYFSIVIAGKNEAENLEELFKSLKCLDYNHSNFEIIFIDDNSEDSTYQKAVGLSEGINNIKVIKCVEKHVAGKKGALTAGIQAAKFPFILITDADCTVTNGWLNTYSMYFNQGYDFLFGIAPFHQNSNNINKISCFENLRNSILSFTLTKLNIPYTASARNFAFRKSAFEIIGGFSNTTETLGGDDDLLLREAIKHNLKIGCITEPNSWVFSNSKNSLKEYLKQKGRHVETSFHYLFSRQLILGFWHGLNLLMLFSSLLFFIDHQFILLFITKILLDLIMIKSFEKKFGYSFKTLEIISLQILYEIFLIINFVNAAAKKTEWK